MKPPRTRRIPATIFIRLFAETKKEGRLIKLVPRFRKYNPKIRLTANRIIPHLIIRKLVKQTF
jgi:hypothetical protein